MSWFLWENSLLISAPKSSVTLFTPDPAHANTRLKIKIVDSELPLVRSPKILKSVSRYKWPTESAKEDLLMIYKTNYIKGRKAYTTYRNHTSSQRQLKTGVLSPTLYTSLYTANGMTDLLDKCPVKETFLPDISRFYWTLSQSFSVDKRLIHARCKIIQKN